MSRIANLMSDVKPSASILISEMARAMSQEGRDVISLSAGEPDFDTPQHIKDAANAAIAAGETKYTPVPGTLSLREAIARKFKRENGLTYGVDEIVVSCGAKHTINLALTATLNPGDEVIIPAPYWVSYPSMVTLARGVPVIADTAENDGFLMSATGLESKITDRTKWLLLNSPSNPSGSAYSSSELESLAEVLRRHPHVLVMCDDIYEHVIYGNFGFVTLAQIAPDLMDRVLTVNGVSKAFSMTGWRIGYAGGPKDIIKAMIKVQGQSTSGVCSIAQAAAVGALDSPMDFIEEWLEAFLRRRDMLVAGLNRIDGLSCRTPSGAFYVYPSCEKILGRKTPDGQEIATDEDFCLYLLKTQGVACVHGAAYGLSPYFRISFAVSDDRLKEALARIEQACASLT